MAENRQALFVLVFFCTVLLLTYCGRGGGTTVVAPPVQNTPADSAPTGTTRTEIDIIIPVPDAPTNLAAAPVSNSSVKLTWTGGLQKGDGFTIERSIDGATFAQIGTAGANAAEYLDTGLLPSTQYQYRIREFSSSGASPYSNTAAASTNPSPTVPVPLPEVPANLVVSAVSTTSITLTWTPGANSDGFIIERSTDSLGFDQTGGAAANASSYMDTALSPATTYQYRIRAYNGAGNSDYSAIVTGTTMAEPLAPEPSAYAMLVALVNYADDGRRPITVADAENIVLNNPDSLNGFIQETSFGKASVSADFIDWTPLPGKVASYTNNVQQLVLDAIQTLDSLADLRKYDRIMIIYAGQVDSSICAQAYMSDTVFKAPRAGLFPTRILQIGTACLTSNNELNPFLSRAILAHEFGHTLGIWHASAYDCPGSPVPKNLMDLRGCTPHGDRSTVMATGPAQYTGIDKAMLGWIGPDQIEESAGSGEFVLDQVETASSGMKILKIPAGVDKSGQTLHYWVEYRKGTGMVDTEAMEYYATYNYSSAKIMDMLYVRMKPVSSTPQSFLTPDGVDQYIMATMIPYKVISGADVNEPFLDPYRGIKVELIEKTGTGADAKARVRVTRSSVQSDPEGSLDFGFADSTAPILKTITVTNTGTATVHLGDATVEGDSHFRINSNSCDGTDLTANGTCSVTLSFANPQYGMLMATLVVATSDPLRPSLAVPLYGMGTGH